MESLKESLNKLAENGQASPRTTNVYNFRKVWPEVKGELGNGWTKKEIWAALLNRGNFSMSFFTFCKYVDKQLHKELAERDRAERVGKAEREAEAAAERARREGRGGR